ncbi:MAG: hypothetical protein ACM3UN_01260 [Bacillota bacterium]
MIIDGLPKTISASRAHFGVTMYYGINHPTLSEDKLFVKIFKELTEWLSSLPKSPLQIQR